MKKLTALSLFVLVVFASCKKDTKTTTTTPAPKIRFVFKFDSTQVRLNSAGQVTAVPAGHAAQCPKFNGMSAHYIEMTQNNITAIGAGAVLYTTPTTPVSPALTVWNSSHTDSATYNDAITFNQETVVGDGQEFFSKPLSQINPGTYPYLRISVAYQNYDIKYAILQGTYVSPTYSVPNNYYSTGTIASFIGYNTYINSYTIKTQTDVVNGPKQQGYWSFETAPYVIPGVGTYTTPYTKGQAPQGATTVVSPSAFATTAVPPGSCLVTGQFVNQTGNAQPLVITGHETSDIVITVSMSTNNSFEWIHNSSNPNDGYIYPLNGDQVVDMGVRGMIPKLPQ
ncbi:MAG TPA: hypothetical protein VKG26_01000 [Bacteroidia bacterium]|nr:hypothetical protein [Bacteroidia bacterium]